MKLRVLTLICCMLLCLMGVEAATNEARWGDIHVYSTDGKKYSTLFDTESKVYRIYTNGDKECTLKVTESKYDYVYVIVSSRNTMPRYLIPIDDGTYRLTIDGWDEDVCVLFSTESLDPAKIVAYMKSDNIFNEMRKILKEYLSDDSDIKYIINNIGFSSLTKEIVPVYIELKGY